MGSGNARLLSLEIELFISHKTLNRKLLSPKRLPKRRVLMVFSGFSGF